jgi:hypothetical protein
MDSVLTVFGKSSNASTSISSDASLAGVDDIIAFCRTNPSPSSPSSASSSSSNEVKGENKKVEKKKAPNGTAASSESMNGVPNGKNKKSNGNTSNNKVGGESKEVKQSSPTASASISTTVIIGDPTEGAPRVWTQAEIDAYVLPVIDRMLSIHPSIALPSFGSFCLSNYFLDMK